MDLSARRACLSHVASQRSPEQTTRLVDDMADFVGAVLDLKCYVALTADTRSRSFLELIVEDGEATFAHSHGCSHSLIERRVVDHNRRVLESRVETLCRFCDRYRFLLGQLMTWDEETIELMDVVACDDMPSGGYFLRLSLAAVLQGKPTHAVQTHSPLDALDAENVTVGGFAFELARLLEEPIETWLLACEQRIEALVPTRDDEIESLARETTRKRSLRQRLVRILSEHIAMVGLYTSSGNGTDLIMERQQSFITTETMERLKHDFADEETIARVKARHDESISQIELLQRICTVSSTPESVAHLLSTRRAAVLEALRAPPAVLVRRPGFARCELKTSTLRAIAARSASVAQSLVVAQVSEWKHSVGRAAFAQFEELLRQSMEMLRKQTFASFLPTLRLMQPPSPTWTDGRRTVEVYARERASIPIAQAHSDAHMQLPATTEQLFRLISVVWELLAYPLTRAYFFTPGNVYSRFLREVVSLEQVNLTFACMTLSAWQQKCSLGRLYRGAANAIANFRGGEAESFLRESFAKLCHWSLGDLLTVASEEFSPRFHSLQWRLVDAVAGVLRRDGRAPTVCSAVVARTLDVVEPMILSLRAESGLRVMARPHPLGELLRTIPAIRAWNGDTDEVVLSIEDVKRSNSKLVRQTLESLSRQRSLVHFGKLRGGSKRGFTFNGPDLSTVLFGEVIDAA